MEGGAIRLILYWGGRGPADHAPSASVLRGPRVSRRRSTRPQDRGWGGRGIPCKYCRRSAHRGSDTEDAAPPRPYITTEITTIARTTSRLRRLMRSSCLNWL